MQDSCGDHHMLEVAELNAEQSLFVNEAIQGYVTTNIGSTARINVTSRVMFSVYESLNAPSHRRYSSTSLPAR